MTPEDEKDILDIEQDIIELKKRKIDARDDEEKKDIDQQIQDLKQEIEDIKETDTMQEKVIDIKEDVRIGDIILEKGDKIKVLEKTSNFTVGDRVEISEDGLKIHSRKTPAHMGYNQFTINWRNNLLDLKKRRIIGVVKMIFPSGRMNVDFEGTTYEVPDYMVSHI